MIISNEPRALQLASRFVPERILKFDPVMAGGFAVWVFKVLERVDGAGVDWDDFLVTLDEAMSKGQKLFYIDYTDSELVKKSFYIQIDFGDIDLWFLKERSGFRLDHIYSSKLWIRTIFDKISLISDLGREYMERPFKDFNIKGKIKYSTDWANTYEVDIPVADKFVDMSEPYRNLYNDKYHRFFKVKIQFIKKPIDSIDELLSAFDIENCKIAIHKNKLYLNEKAASSFSNSKVCINGSLADKEDIYGRIITALRVFKYCKRLGLEPDNLLSDEIFNLYLDILEHPEAEKLKKEFVGDFFIEFGESDVDDGSYLYLFGGKNSKENKHILRNKMREMLNFFPLFVGLDSFDPIWLAYFIGTEFRIINEVVEKVIYKKPL